MEPHDIVQYMRFAAALVFVLCLMGALSFVVKKLGLGNAAVLQPGKKRLKIIEILPIDPRRRAVLLQRDERQHLVILGLSGETVVETGIEAPEPASAARHPVSPETPVHSSPPPLLPKAVPFSGLGGVLRGAARWFGRRPLLSAAIAFAATFAAAVMICGPALAQTLTLDLGRSEDGSFTGRLVQLVALLTVLSLAPSILIMMTSFTRVIVVLSFLRTAIGVQQTPPNTVVISLALFLTFFIMAPTMQAAWKSGIQPYMNEDIDETTAFERSVAPFKTFMLKQVRETDLELFVNLSGTGPYKEPMAVPIHIVIPAFMISELRRAFEMGFMLFLPFLIIDMVTASILMSMGMMMLPPVTISLPFKIIFFVLVDGWYLVAGSLVRSFENGPPIPIPPG